MMGHPAATKRRRGLWGLLLELLPRRTDKRGALRKPDVPHYNGGIQPVDFCRSRQSHEEFRGAMRFNIIKYVSRFHLKDGVKDLRKARDYLTWLIEHEERRAPPR